MVTSSRSISDFDQTVSWDRLPHRIAARMEPSRFTSSTSAVSAVLNSSSTLAALTAAGGFLDMQTIVTIICLPRSPRVGRGCLTVLGFCDLHRGHCPQTAL